MPDTNETTGGNRRYHVKMLLADLGLWKPHEGDTRGCLFIDRSEAQILTELLEAEFRRLNQDTDHG
jgi:hypothetical protein